MFAARGSVPSQACALLLKQPNHYNSPLGRFDRTLHVTGGADNNLVSQATASGTKSCTRQCICGNSPLYGGLEQLWTLVDRPSVHHVLPHGVPPDATKESPKYKKEMLAWKTYYRAYCLQLLMRAIIRIYKHDYHTRRNSRRSSFVDKISSS